MLGEKAFAVTLDVTDPVGLAADAGPHLLARLRQDFVGRGHLGSFIVRVLSVLRRSAIRLVATNTSGQATVDVQFLAEVVVFGLGDLLAPVEIVRVAPMVVGRYRWRPEPPPDGEARAAVDVGLSLLPGRGAAAAAVAALAVGHRVAVRVICAEVQPGQPAYAVAAELLACDTAAPAFSLQGALSRADGAALAPLAERVEAELKARAALPADQKEALWFVERAFYAFARPADGPAGARPEAVCPAWSGPPGAAADEPGEPRDLLALVRAAGGAGAPVAGVWARPLSFYRSAPCAAVAPEGKAPPGWPEPTASPALPVFATFLRETLGYLEATRALAAALRTPGERERHAGLWAALRGAQRK